MTNSDYVNVNLSNATALYEDRDGDDGQDDEKTY